MPDSAKRIGIAPDHEGFESKHLKGMLLAAHYEAVDHGDSQPKPDDDYPDFVVPLARAVARGEVGRGVAICGEPVKVFLEAQFSGLERYLRRVTKVAGLECNSE